MDSRLAVELSGLGSLSHRRISQVLESESPRHYELTKALVDVLYNICVVQSVEAPEDLKRVLEEHESVVRQLLARKVSLAAKKALLLAHVPLVAAAAQACPQLA